MPASFAGWPGPPPMAGTTMKSPACAYTTLALEFTATSASKKLQLRFSAWQLRDRIILPPLSSNSNSRPHHDRLLPKQPRFAPNNSIAGILIAAEIDVQHEFLHA